VDRIDKRLSIPPDTVQDRMLIDIGRNISVQTVNGLKSAYVLFFPPRFSVIVVLALLPLVMTAFRRRKDFNSRIPSRPSCQISNTACGLNVDGFAARRSFRAIVYRACHPDLVFAWTGCEALLYVVASQKRSWSPELGRDLPRVQVSRDAGATV
jgi:hypothetical protein